MPNAPSTQPEGASRPVRHRFSDREKLRIPDAADACTRPGEIGLLLRREGIYTSHLASWRRWRMRAHPDRVPAGTEPTDSQLRHENARLEREVARLRLKLEHAEKLHLLQKRMAEMMEELDRDATSQGGGGRA